ncbi:Dbl homology domain-containing protein [Thozetella sp. PMI_491]|nr:Dbl homology domain-containing protein [Thozetella sp. PMI_491]
MRSADYHQMAPSRRSLSLTRRDLSWTTIHQSAEDHHPAKNIEEAAAADTFSLQSIEGLPSSGTDIPRTLDNLPTGRLEHDTSAEQLPDEVYPSVDGGLATGAPQAFVPDNRRFQKWMKTLQKRASRRGNLANPGEEPDPYRISVDGAGSLQATVHHRNSSESSFAFVTAVRSVGSSLASVSLLTRSRRSTLRSSRRTDRSSGASMSIYRTSEDSFGLDRPATLDLAVTERALQRRRILEELITTEESYIGDIRFLMNVYVTILASSPTTSAGLRTSVNLNLTELVELHEEILGELHRAVPHSEYTQVNIPHPRHGGDRPGNHHRWKSLDMVPEGKAEMHWLQNLPGMTSDPQTAAEVAKVFSKRMNRFFIYEEYGAKYELLIKDVAATCKTMPRWDSYQRGLEALAASLDSANSRENHRKKSVTIADLLMKPIQRVCRYPLLFAELLKNTPVVDCPYSHMEIENTLLRLREATAEINKATDDVHVRSALEKTWTLQDRLVLPNQSLDTASKNGIRSLGHIQLCGALHVCWQTTQGVDGQYMVVLLYRDWLCLATASKVDPIYTIQACIALANLKIEDVDNGRGLQCHTAPYSWKVVFMCDHQLYEMVMTACTSKEEEEWRSRLSNPPHIEGRDQVHQPPFNSLSLNMKSLGTVFGKPGTVARRISIHRATTVGPKSPLCQVILKNTSAVRDAPLPSNSRPINRSQSLICTSHKIPVLAPPHSARARIEASLSDVWTRDVLPFPGITTRSRSEKIVRASASSMMRKLSVATITTSFARRSASATSLNKAIRDGEGFGALGLLAEEKAATHSDRPIATSDEVPEDGCDSSLSIIPDGQRRSASGATVSTESSAEWAANVFRAVPGLEELQAPEDVMAAVPSTSPAMLVSKKVRMSSSIDTHGRRLNRSVSSDFSSMSLKRVRLAASEEKEACSTSPRQPCNSRNMSGSRWTRIGAFHRDAVVQGFRSIFR